MTSTFFGVCRPRWRRQPLPVRSKYTIHTKKRSETSLPYHRQGTEEVARQATTLTVTCSTLVLYKRSHFERLRLCEVPDTQQVSNLTRKRKRVIIRIRPIEGWLVGQWSAPSHRFHVAALFWRTPAGPPQLLHWALLEFSSSSSATHYFSLPQLSQQTETYHTYTLLAQKVGGALIRNRRPRSTSHGGILPPILPCPCHLGKTPHLRGGAEARGA